MENLTFGLLLCLALFGCSPKNNHTQDDKHGSEQVAGVHDHEHQSVRTADLNDHKGVIGEIVTDSTFQRLSAYASKYLIVSNRDLASCSGEFNSLQCRFFPALGNKGEICIRREGYEAQAQAEYFASGDSIVFSGPYVDASLTDFDTASGELFVLALSEGVKLVCSREYLEGDVPEDPVFERFVFSTVSGRADTISSDENTANYEIGPFFKRYVMRSLSQTLLSFSYSYMRGLNTTEIVFIWDKSGNLLSKTELLTAVSEDDSSKNDGYSIKSVLTVDQDVVEIAVSRFDGSVQKQFWNGKVFE